MKSRKKVKKEVLHYSACIYGTAVHVWFENLMCAHLYRDILIEWGYLLDTDFTHTYVKECLSQSKAYLEYEKILQEYRVEVEKKNAVLTYGFVFEYTTWGETQDLKPTYAVGIYRVWVEPNKTRCNDFSIFLSYTYSVPKDMKDVVLDFIGRMGWRRRVKKQHIWFSTTNDNIVEQFYYLLAVLYNSLQVVVGKYEVHIEPDCVEHLAMATDTTVIDVVDKLNAMQTRTGVSWSSCNTCADPHNLPAQCLYILNEDAKKTIGVVNRLEDLQFYDGTDNFGAVYTGTDDFGVRDTEDDFEVADEDIDDSITIPVYRNTQDTESEDVESVTQVYGTVEESKDR